MNRILVIISLVIFFISCDKQEESTFNMTIASKSVQKSELTVLIVKHENSNEWTWFWDVITGFEYQEGHEYEINVTSHRIKKPQMDESSIKYTLNYIISDIEKESEDIPSDLLNE